MRIAAYGGTFDPIHNGHVEVARAVAANFDLDELLIVPAHRPPHKRLNVIEDEYHRYAMAVLATISEAHVKVSTIELEMPERPYTFETMGRLAEIYGRDTELFFVMGADSYADLMTWREPASILERASLIVAARPGVEIASDHLPAGMQRAVVDCRTGDAGRARGAQADGGRIYLTDYVRQDVSSTEIRRRTCRGESIRGMVAGVVADYVEKYGLYRR